MRILLLNYEFPPLGGGSATASAQIATYMARRGVEVVVLTAHFKGLPRVERRDGYIIHRVPAMRRRMDRCTIPQMAGYIAGAALPALRLTERFRPDLMHIYNGMPTGPVGLLVNRMKGVPYLLSLRGADVPWSMGRELAFMHWLTMPLTKQIWRRASRILTNSNGLRQLAMRTLADKPIEVVPNGIDLGFFRPKAGPREADGKIRVLYAGRLAGHKGLPYLLRALSLLKREVLEQIELEIVGGGPDEDRLKSLARELRIETAVHFTGWVSRTDIVDHYQRSHIFVLPSLAEGMPNAILEAMACGNAIVATRVRGNSELVRDSVNGFLVPPSDAKALSQALEKVICDGALRAEMGRNSHLLASRYDWSSTADRYLVLSEAILAERAPQGVAHGVGVANALSQEVATAMVAQEFAYELDNAPALSEELMVSSMAQDLAYGLDDANDPAS